MQEGPLLLPPLIYMLSMISSPLYKFEVLDTTMAFLYTDIVIAAMTFRQLAATLVLLL